MGAFYLLIGKRYSSGIPTVKHFATVFDRVEMTVGPNAGLSEEIVSIACETFRSIIYTTG